MGRIISSSSAASTGNNTTAPVSTTVTTGEAVIQGQIATLGADLLAYAALDPLAPSASLRPVVNTTQINDGIQLPVIPVSASVGASAGNLPAYDCAVLSNGNLLMAWVAGGASPYAVNFAIYSPSGVLISSGTTAATTTLQHVVIALLTGGNFVLGQVAANTVKFTIYNSAGTVVTALTTVDAAYAVSVQGFSFKPLLTGGFVVVWNNQAPTYFTPRYAVFSASGTVVKGATTLNAVTANPTGNLSHSVGVDVLASGSFVVAYGVATSTYMQIFNSAGVQTLAETVVSGSGSTAYVTALAGGGFAIFGSSTSVYIYNAAGTLQGSPVLPAYNYVVAAALSDGGIGFVTISFGVVSATKFTASAAVVGTLTLSSAAASSSLIGMLAMSNGTVTASWSATGAIGGVGLAQISASWTLTSTSASLTQLCNQTGAGGYLTMAQLVNPVKPTAITYAVLCDYPTTTTLNLGIYNQAVQKYTPIGVFGASAASGATVPVQYVGNATLAAAFTQPYAINQQSATPPGVKMNVIGNSAILYGIQPPPVQRNIN